MEFKVWSFIDWFVWQDGKDGIKFYTDANYFFELWRAEMLQSTEKAEKVRRGGLKGSRFDYPQA